MATVLKSTSTWLDVRKKRADIYVDLFTVFFLLLGALYVGFYIINWDKVLLLYGSLLLFLTLLVVLVKGIFILTKHIRNHSIGYNAEIEIQKILEKLPNDYYISRDPIEYKYGNVDFVVIGPTGIFAIEVKASNVKLDVKYGRLAYNDLNKHYGNDFIKRTKYGALKVSNHLKTCGLRHYVQPILVFTNAYNLRQGKKKLDSTYVIRKEWLNDIILENKGSINKKQFGKLLVCLGH